MSASTSTVSPTVRLIGYEPKSISGATLSRVMRSALFNSLSIIERSAFFLIVFGGLSADGNLQCRGRQVLQVEILRETEVLFGDAKCPAARVEHRRIHTNL